MSTGKRISALAATTALVGLTALGITAPAATAAAPTAAITAAGGTAPACIHRHVHTHLAYVRLSNYCGKTMYVAVVTGGLFGGTGSCHKMPNHSVRSESWNRITEHYRKTVVC
ncbi:hypothetical protein [Streptomyces sp. NPDC001604]|uniref:hypothetical protein n=1 Tax=Streptomyces sp. NPDC001604 TaxID=3364593 RepID=UPI003676C417